MTVHTEWLSTRDAFTYVEYGWHTDAYGTESDGPALIIGNDQAIVIEGTPDEIRRFLQRCEAVLPPARSTD